MEEASAFHFNRKDFRIPSLLLNICCYQSTKSGLKVMAAISGGKISCWQISTSNFQSRAMVSCPTSGLVGGWLGFSYLAQFCSDDSTLFFQTHINNISQSAYYHLCQPSLNRGPRTTSRKRHLARDNLKLLFYFSGPNFYWHDGKKNWTFWPSVGYNSHSLGNPDL